MLMLSQSDVVTEQPVYAATKRDDESAGVGGWTVFLIAMAIGAVGYAVGFERGTSKTTRGTKRVTRSYEE